LLDKLFCLFPIPPNKNEKVTKNEIKKFGKNISSSTENESSEHTSVVATLKQATPAQSYLTGIYHNTFNIMI
jgi:hypothetical protein